MLDKLVDDLKDLEGNDVDTFSAITVKVENFYQEYEKSINNYSWEQTLTLLNAAAQLYDSIMVSRDLIHLIQQDLEPQAQVSEENAAASLFFQGTTDYEEVLNKLLALNSLYSELCLLADVSRSQYPLKLIKIESGSLWIKLFGESRVIMLLTSILRRL